MPLMPPSLSTGASASPPAASPAQVEWGYVGDAGRLVLSPEMRRSLGLEPVARMYLERDGNTIRRHRSGTRGGFFLSTLHLLRRL